MSNLGDFRPTLTDLQGNCEQLWAGSNSVERSHRTGYEPTQPGVAIDLPGSATRAGRARWGGNHEPIIWRRADSAARDCASSGVRGGWRAGCPANWHDACPGRGDVGREASSVTGKQPLQTQGAVMLTWTGPPDGLAGQAGGGGDPSPGVLRSGCRERGGIEYNCSCVWRGYSKAGTQPRNEELSEKRIAGWSCMPSAQTERNHPGAASSAARGAIYRLSGRK